MPAIGKIRFTNVVYENGGKRYNDEIFDFDGHNSALLLENGGGKTVFIQTALQAIIPHIDMAERKIKDTLSLENAPAHIAIEWIINEQPRRYALTATSLYIENNQLNSLKYTYDYSAGDDHGIEQLPFAKELENGGKRPASRGEISEYYARMNKQMVNAKTFKNISDYGKYIERTYKIIPSEWRKVAVINSGEGNVDEFFNKCKSTDQLLNNLLIPVVEEAIEGDNTAKFVETFERQREHFKKNRILQEKIEQSRLVKEQIDDYIKIYKNYEKERLNLLEERGKAKSLMGYIGEQINRIKETIAFVDEGFELLKRDQIVYEQKALSFEWLKDKEALGEVKKDYQHLLEEIEAKQKAYDEKGQRKQNIELTRIQKNIQGMKDKLQIVIAQIVDLDKDVESGDLQHQLDENSSWIKGHYLYELQLIQREINRIDEAMTVSEGNIATYTEQYNDYRSFEKELIAKRSLLLAKGELINDELVSMEETLFEEQEIKVPSLLLEKIEEKIASYSSKHDTVLHNIKESESQLESLIASGLMNEQLLNENKSRLIEIEQGLEIIEQEGQKVREELTVLGHHTYLLDELYLKEQTLIGAVEEAVEELYREKEEALLVERKQYRQIDLYDGLTFFSPEPNLENVVKELKGQTSFVSSGMDYFHRVKESLGLETEVLFNRFPFWPVTIVCSVNDENYVKGYINCRREYLSSMVLVMTIEGINQKLKEDHNDDIKDWIIPMEWEGHLEENFAFWLKSLKKEVVSYKESRIEKERQYMHLNQILKEIRGFYEDYSYGSYKNYLESKNDLSNTQNSLKLKIQEEEKLKADLEKSLNEAQMNLAELNDQMAALSNVKNDVLVLIEKEKGHQVIMEELKSVLDQYKECEMNLQGSEKKVEDEKQQLIRLKEEKSRFVLDEEKLKELELYKEVENFEAVGTTSSMGVLVEQRKRLKNAIMGIKGNSHDLEEKKEHYESLIKEYEHNYRQKEKEAIYPIDVIEVSYEKEEEDLFDLLKEWQKELNGYKVKRNDTEKKMTELETRCAINKEKCESLYGQLYPFEMASGLLESVMKIEKSTLIDREKKLASEKAESANSLSVLSDIEQKLLIKDGAFGFMLEEIETVGLSKQEYEAFGVSPQKEVEQLIRRLEGQQKVTREAFGRVGDKKDAVLDFCKEEIQDIRLKETVVNGLNNKGDYKGLLMYQEKMTEIIMKIVQVAEDDRRESDVELQTFLSHLIAYIRNVATELDMIQNKTRIELDNVWKQIFIFDVPSWTEEEGRLRLRSYIDETIDYYERESLKENVEAEKLRVMIKERLGVKNLLQVVIGDERIKIKCRKVTNDMKINKAPMAWESSNKWSGGEKWSKNMTLFLSILNYLAEKKQHLSAYQKRQRSVILDNPFGKASSDHVLKPVFTIAEKLGFQIIALTAHAEGKFISEYFPVVYSCRLRQTKDQSKQLMTNERTLNYAYLKEYSPKTIMRMQEVTQLNLFEL